MMRNLQEKSDSIPFRRHVEKTPRRIIKQTFTLPLFHKWEAHKHTHARTLERNEQLSCQNKLDSLSALCSKEMALEILRKAFKKGYNRLISH